MHVAQYWVGIDQINDPEDLTYLGMMITEDSDINETQTKELVDKIALRREKLSQQNPH